LSKFRRKKLKANLLSSTHSLFSDKARCFSQSACALYGNFIIILYKGGDDRVVIKILKSDSLFYQIALSSLVHVTNQGLMK